MGHVKMDCVIVQTVTPGQIAAFRRIRVRGLIAGRMEHAKTEAVCALTDIRGQIVTCRRNVQKMGIVQALRHV